MKFLTFLAGAGLLAGAAAAPVDGVSVSAPGGVQVDTSGADGSVRVDGIGEPVAAHWGGPWPHGPGKHHGPHPPRLPPGGPGAGWPGAGWPGAGWPAAAKDDKDEKRSMADEDSMGQTPSMNEGQDQSGSQLDLEGDGSVGAGWPSMGSWLSFENLWERNEPSMRSSCASPDTATEIQNIREAIMSQASSVDTRFILAVMMQESHGCVRAPTTSGAPGLSNPGLMQSFAGQYSCNQNGEVQSPCPQEQINDMIQEGVRGTGPQQQEGLSTFLQTAQSEGATGAQAYYVAARLYNSGPNSCTFPCNLSGPGATPMYASDIASRLMGWVN